MAEIEEAENGSTGKVREWLSRAVRASRDPVWTADGVVSDVWLPVSPVTGRIDAFEWKMPVERLGAPVMSYSDDVLADIDEPEQPKLVGAPPAAPKPEEAAPPEPSAKVEVLKPEPLKPPPRRPPLSPVLASHPVPDDPGPGADQANTVVRFPING
jgi:HemY protein